MQLEKTILLFHFNALKWISFYAKVLCSSDGLITRGVVQINGIKNKQNKIQFSLNEDQLLSWVNFEKK